MIEIKIINKINEQILEEINFFAKEFSGEYYKGIKEKNLRKIIKQPNVWIMGVCKDNKLIGMALLYKVKTITKKVLVFEEFIIDKKFRGQGFGRILIKEIIEFGKRLDVNFIECVTKQDNEKAQGLYFGLGFEDRKNMALRLKL